MNTELLPDTDTVTIEALDFAYTPPCEANRPWHRAFGSSDAAAWIVHLVRCCPVRPAAKAMCDGCKDAVVNKPEAICATGCQTVWRPARLSATLIEPLTP